MAIQITTTSDDKQELESIAKFLIDEQLAACCQILGPIVSLYRWNNRIERADEWMCLIKTEDSLYDAVEIAIKQHHHYEQPEIVATQIVRGSVWILKLVVEPGQPIKRRPRFSVGRRKCLGSIPGGKQIHPGNISDSNRHLIPHPFARRHLIPRPFARRTHWPEHHEAFSLRSPPCPQDQPGTQRPQGDLHPPLRLEARVRSPPAYRHRRAT